MNSIKKLATPIILWILREAAKEKLRQIHPLIIGVAGSSGKTSLSLLLSIVLKEKYRVKQSGGKNSETGLPLNILGISLEKNTPREWIDALLSIPFILLKNKHTYDIYIAEMGIDAPVEPKNMSYLLKFINPQIGIVTNISLEHSVYFDQYIQGGNEQQREEQLLAMTASQENMLLTSLPLSGSAIINIDDPLINQVQQDIRAEKITISFSNKQADFYVRHLILDPHTFAMEFMHLGKEYILRLGKPLPQHFVYQILFSIAVAKKLGVSIRDAIDSIENEMSIPPGRMTIFNGIHNTTIIDSSYNNATLLPMLDMLDFLVAIAKKKRKVAIVGDMRELGSMSKMIHEKVAKHMIKTVDTAILIGPLMRNYVAPLLERAHIPYQSFLTFTEAKEYIMTTIKTEDVILVKGSQNTLFLERVVELLLADKTNISKLCRRGEFWDTIRNKTV